MLTAAQIITQAAQDAHAPGFVVAAQNKLQIILDELCFKNDFALARGVYYFNLNPTTIQTIGGITNFGGPYPLPLDYLRTSGSSGSEGVQYSFFYVFQGVPYPLMPWDLGREDMQVQQPGIQNLPYAYATDISTETTAQDRFAGITTASTTAGSPTITVFSPSGAAVGMSISGYGIAPGSTITAMSGVGNATWTLSLNCTGTFTGALSSGTAGAGASSIMFGTPANAFVYPGPSGAFPTTLRYQRLMPPLVDLTRIPWFPDQQYLLTRLTAEIMASADDERYAGFVGRSADILGKYESFADDKTNRAQTVILDRRRFGRAFNKLNNTKTIGW
jgi:hypothetical protein